MSDLLEKMYREEQDTDEKFVAAAKFFMGLKEKTAVKAPPPIKKVRVKSLSTDKPSPAAATRQNTKRLIAKGSGKSISLTMPGKVSGQSAVRDSRSFKKTTIKATGAPAAPTKKLPAVKKPRVKVVIASAMTQHLIKEAYLLQGAKGLLAKGLTKGKGGVDGVKTFFKNKKDAAVPFVGGATTDGKSLLRSKIEGALKNFGRQGPKSSIPTSSKFLYRTRSTMRNIGDNLRNADRVGVRRAGSKSFNDWAKSNPMPAKYGSEGIDPKYTAWVAARKKAKSESFQGLKSFDSGRAAENALGVNSTGRSVIKSIRGKDGKITTKSVMKGAEDLGLFDPATLTTLGMGAAQSIRAGKAARAAAQKEKMMKWGLGGAAGIGALALVKNSGKKTPPSNYS